MSSNTHDRSDRRRVRRRIALAGALGAGVLAGGAGFAYAATDSPIQSGYAVLVDETGTALDVTSSDDCPYGDPGDPSGIGEAGGSAATSVDGSLR